MAIKVGGINVIDDSRQLNVSGISTISNLQVSGISTLTNVRVTGITTLGTVIVTSGIITASSGIITYYGDGSRLIGAGLSAGATQSRSLINALIFG
jgi:hypothetical protein